MNNDQAKNLRELMNKTKHREETDIKNKTYVFVGREGSGNTTIVSNLSSLMAKDGKKVILIDFNSGLLTTDIFFNVIPNRNINDVLNSDKGEKEMLVKVQENLYVVYGKKILESSSDEKNRFSQKVESLKQDADIILADIQGVENLSKLMFFLEDTEIVFVTVPDADGIQETYYGIKYLKSNMNIDKVGIIINKSDSFESSNRFFEKLEETANRFLEIKVEKIGYVCMENEVKDSMKNQRLFTDVYPELKSATEIMALKERLSN